MSFAAAYLPGGRLHLHHGPIDLVIGAEGARAAAFEAAIAGFDGVLERLVEELDLLRRGGWWGETPPYGGAPAERVGSKPTGSRGDATPRGWPVGPVAQRMVRAVARHAGFVTPMAAVAGAVADHVLAAMGQVDGLRRAYVNNGGDIALHLGADEGFALAMAAPDGREFGRVRLRQRDGIGGIATSGQGGRSLSLGIAESVTVLARDAAAADVAATLIANAVDLPGHGAVRREPACEIRPDSDLGARCVVTHVGALTRDEVAAALARGQARAEAMRAGGLIAGAALFLRGQARVTGAEEMLQIREVAHV